MARCAIDCVKAAKRVKRSGRLPGSLEPEETAGVDYWVADGHLIRQHCPKLSDLYISRELKEHLRKLTGLELTMVPDMASCMNVNVLPAGHRYEKHVDDWGITMVVPLTQCGGGRLLFEGAPVEHLDPVPGKGLIFNGTLYPHEVELVTSGVRLSLIFEFLVEGAPVERSEGLSEALYGLD